MVIDIDLYTATLERLSPNEYILLYLLNKNHLVTTQKLFKFTDFITKEQMGKLIEDGYIDADLKFNKEKYTELLNYLKVTDKFKRLLPKLPDDPFEELVEKFPTKVKRQNGVFDYLKTGLKRCKPKYNSLIKKKPNLHNHILQCLDYELATRRKENTMQWMRKVPNWIENEEWKAFEDDMIKERDGGEKSDTKKVGYGNELL